MKKQILSIAAALTALTLNSCLQHEGTINLNKDGSGTIVEETTMSAQALAMRSSIGSLETEGADNDQKEDKDSDPFNEWMTKERNDKRSKELGEGVTFVKAEPITVGTNKGVRITYRFADINKVRIGCSDAMDMMNSEMEAQDEKAEDKDKISFSYKNGLLTVKPHFDFDAEGAEGENTKEEVTDKEIGMMKLVMTDMKMSLKLSFESGIAESNATHKENDTVTIFEMDMNKVMENPEGCKKFMGIKNADPANAMKEIDMIDGIKAEAKPEITIKLK